MREWLILRHAKSSWKDSSLDDHDRPLNKRGKRDCPRIGALLAERELLPDVVLTSTANRALATARRVLEAAECEAEIVATRELYHAAPSTYRRLAEAAPRDGRVMLVGHNPGLEDLIEELVGRYERFPTAALAHVVWSAEGEPRLANLWRPRELL